MMLIKCSQLGCTDFQPKVINRSLSGTNNYKRHYEKFHPGIPTSEKEVRAMKLVRKLAHGQNFFQKDKAEQTVNQRFRTLLLEFIIKNNLSFSIVDQLETEQLLTFLSPTTTQISRRTLMKDLKARYEVGEELLHQKLLDHVEQGGRISLTTDGWAGNNKMDYSAITGHYITTSGEHVLTILDIIELSKPIHDGQYLCEKLLEVTERLDITCAIIAVTRDNASPNDTMLAQFEAEVEAKWELLNEDDQARFYCKFNRKEGDVRCCAHIYNIAVQTGKILFL